jgi:hypothetical protein
VTLLSFHFIFGIILGFRSSCADRFYGDNCVLVKIKLGYFIVFLKHVLFTFKRHLIITLLHEETLLFIILEMINVFWEEGRKW